MTRSAFFVSSMPAATSSSPTWIMIFIDLLSQLMVFFLMLISVSHFTPDRKAALVQGIEEKFDSRSALEKKGSQLNPSLASPISGQLQERFETELARALAPLLEEHSVAFSTSGNWEVRLPLAKIFAANTELAPEATAALVQTAALMQQWQAQLPLRLEIISSPDFPPSRLIALVEQWRVWGVQSAALAIGQDSELKDELLLRWVQP
jgi:hypothetical protein